MAIIITGASRGIGRATALEFSRKGYDLFLVARDLKALEETKAACLAEIGSAQGQEIRIVTESFDLTVESVAEDIFSRFSCEFTALEGLVNNAGIVMSGKIGSYSQKDWNTIMAINAAAPFFLMQEGVNQYGSSLKWIINVGSIVSKRGYENQALYTASKHALLGFSKSAARDLASRGIRVHAVLPGGVNTDMVRSVRPDIDTRELINPAEVAKVIADLAGMTGNAVIDEVTLRRKSKTPFS